MSLLIYFFELEESWEQDLAGVYTYPVQYIILKNVTENYSHQCNEIHYCHYFIIVFTFIICIKIQESGIITWAGMYTKYKKFEKIRHPPFFSLLYSN
jgi:hypothetical protein